MQTTIRYVDMIAAEVKYHEVCSAHHVAKHKVSYKSYKETVDEDLCSKVFLLSSGRDTTRQTQRIAFNMTILLGHFLKV